MFEMIGLLFNLDEKTSKAYLAELETAAKNQKWDAKIQVNESLSFPSIYGYLKKNSTSSESGITAVLTQGSNSEEIFLRTKADWDI